MVEEISCRRELNSRDSSSAVAKDAFRSSVMDRTTGENNRDIHTKPCPNYTAHTTDHMWHISRFEKRKKKQDSENKIPSFNNGCYHHRFLFPLFFFKRPILMFSRFWEAITSGKTGKFRNAGKRNTFN